MHPAKRAAIRVILGSGGCETGVACVVFPGTRLSGSIAPESMLNDPLLYSYPLPLVHTIFPMGFPARITTNSADVICAADEMWGIGGARFDCPPLDIRFAVDETSKSERPPAVLPRAKDHLLAFVHSADNFAIADMFRGSSFSWLTPSVVDDRGYFCYHFLEPLVYTMLGALYLTPIHAACIAWNDSGILLCGDTGAGKTSLAYACARRGWTYVADDASHLLRPGLDRRILGRPHQIRFRSTAALLFPELAAFSPVQRANGKFDLEIKTSLLDIPHTAPEVRADYLVFPKRDTNEPAGLYPMEKSQAAKWLYHVLNIHEDGVHEAQQQSLSALLDRPIFELRYSDLGDAEARLRSLATHEA